MRGVKSQMTADSMLVDNESNMNSCFLKEINARMNTQTNKD